MATHLSVGQILSDRKQGQNLKYTRENKQPEDHSVQIWQLQMMNQSAVPGGPQWRDPEVTTNFREKDHLDWLAISVKDTRLGKWGWVGQSINQQKGRKGRTGILVEMTIHHWTWWLAGMIHLENIWKTTKASKYKWSSREDIVIETRTKPWRVLGLGNRTKQLQGGEKKTDNKKKIQ